MEDELGKAEIELEQKVKTLQELSEEKISLQLAKKLGEVFRKENELIGKGLDQQALKYIMDKLDEFDEEIERKEKEIKRLKRN
ncbi:MAG: hypothetical protein ACP5RK_01070 [Candidatus Micrarchaeia archaeon]